VRKRPWKIGEHTGQRLVCAFHSADHQNVNWPWPFAARSTCALGERTLSMRLALWNQGATPMPAGLGWHPYFNRALTRQGEPVQLRFKVQGAYPDAHGNRIPSGPPHLPLEHQDFSSGRPLAPENFLDTCFCGYDGNGHIAWPQSNVRLRFACSAACSHLVIYNPQGKPYFAVEPVSNANNGVNLLARGDSTSGVVVLEPGQSLEAGFELHLEEVA
jgi:aldose 1-epimerase